MKNTRPVSWIKAARKDFDEFPEHVQRDMLTALTIKTPQMEITLIRERLKQLKEALK